MVLHANFVCELKIRIEKKMNLLVLLVRPSNSSYETRIRNSPEIKFETKLFTKLFRFCVLAQFIFLGVSDTKLGYETSMWVFVGTFVSEFRIRTSFPPIRN